MRILMLCGEAVRGGAQTHITTLLRALRAAGHEITAVYTAGDGESIFSGAGVSLYYLPLSLSRPWSIVSGYRRLCKLIRTNRRAGTPFTVLHAHTRLCAAIGCRAARRYGLANVVTVHGIYQKHPLLARFCQYGDHTLAVSPDIALHLIRQTPALKAQLTVTVNGVDAVYFSKQNDDQSPPAQGHRILALSRLDADTFLPAQALLAALPRILCQYPQTELWFAGDGTHRAALQEMALPLLRQSPHAVRFLGAVADVRALIAACDLVVAVSRAAMEAILMEKPVLCEGQFGAGGFFCPALYARALSTNLCFRDAPPTDAARMAEQILAFFRMPQAEVRTILQQNRAFIAAHYSVTQMCTDAESAYTAAQKPLLLLAGYYGYDNLGDEVLCKAAVRVLQQHTPSARLVILSGSVSKSRRLTGCTALWRYRLWSISHLLARADALVFGGGNILQNQTSGRSLTYYVWLLRVAKRTGARRILLSNGIGPLFGNRAIRAVAASCRPPSPDFHSKSHIFRTRPVFLTSPETHSAASCRLNPSEKVPSSGGTVSQPAVPRSDIYRDPPPDAALPAVPIFLPPMPLWEFPQILISVRDAVSRTQLRQLGIATADAQIVPDLSAALPLVPDFAALPLRLPALPLAVVSIRISTGKEATAFALRQLLPHLRQGGGAVLFPMQPKDGAACRKFLHRMARAWRSQFPKQAFPAHAVHLCAPKEATLPALLALLADPRTKLVLSDRLHLWIFARRYRIPVVPLPGNFKLRAWEDTVAEKA